jgi:predicted DNA-binding protein (UPF0278 family)
MAERKSIGILSVSKVAKMPEFKQWQKDSEAFSAAKTASSESKEKLRQALRRKIPQLKDVENIDVLLVGEELTVYQVSKDTATRKRNVTELEIA